VKMNDFAYGKCEAGMRERGEMRAGPSSDFYADSTTTEAAAPFAEGRTLNFKGIGYRMPTAGGVGLCAPGSVAPATDSSSGDVDCVGFPSSPACTLPIN